MKYFKNIKISLTPLNLILMAAFLAGLIYTTVHLVGIIAGVSMPVISDSYLEDQVRVSFEAAKFTAKIEDPKIEKNLFHPDRRPVKRVALPSLATEGGGNPQFALYGTFISPDLQMAYIEDIANPQVSSTGVQRQQALKKGDMISGFVLKEIYPDKILLVRDNEKIFVPMVERKAKKEDPEKTSEESAQQPPLQQTEPQNPPAPEVKIPLPPKGWTPPI